MLSKEEILELIIDKESDRVERTVATDDTDKFAEVICAFSNDLANHKKPGYLLIGVHDKTCKLSGLKVTDRLPLKYCLLIFRRFGTKALSGFGLVRGAELQMKWKNVY